MNARQREGTRRQAEACAETALQAIERGPRRVRDSEWWANVVYQWAREAAHYARILQADTEARERDTDGTLDWNDKARQEERADLRARQDEEAERFASGEHEPPTVCDTCGAIIPDGEGSEYGEHGEYLVCARCARRVSR